MRFSILLLILTSFFASPRSVNAEPALVSPVSGRGPRFTVVSSKLDASAKVAEVTFESAMGIFIFNYHPPKLELLKVRFVVQKVTTCEGLTFWPNQGNAIPLREREGCSIQPKDGNLIIELTGAALKELGKGGKVQFVNAYR